MDLGGVVRHYLAAFRACARAELESFRGEPTFVAAVRRAGRAEQADGRRFQHQWRSSPAHLEAAAERLVDRAIDLAAASDFAKLYDVVGAVVNGLPGVGEMYIYDTALRIGAYKETLPEEVFLHASTRASARALGVEVEGRRSLAMHELPAELHILEPHEVEDVLCIYKDHLTGNLDLHDERASWTDEEITEVEAR